MNPQTPDSDAPTLADPLASSDPNDPERRRLAQPDWIAGYRVVRVLGEGGMGTVFLAEQTKPFHRYVAIKLIRGQAFHSKALARFEAERQALARMTHPNIAQVYESGVTGHGEPYIVMELVHGERVTDYCDRRRLPIESRLELFTQVCRGVSHAHQKGVIHRDLKPSNILVAEDAGRPLPKLIDFGIAKALDEPLTDREGLTGERLIGTPGYLSPEVIQAADGGGGIDTRSDVYSLGVVLYELMTGVLPFGGSTASFVEIVRRADARLEPPVASTRLSRLEAADLDRVAEGRSTSPTALRRRLRGELDLISSQALAPEVDRRYDSVDALNDDIRRHLEHEPIAAAPASHSYRARKFVRRHTVGVASAALLLAVMAIGIVTTTIAARKAAREAEAARQVTAFLVDLFRVSDPSQARGESITAREILDRGALRIERELAGQPLIRASLLDTIGTVYSQLGLYESAGPLLEEGLRLHTEYDGPEATTTATSLHHLALLAMAVDELDESEQLFRRSLAILESTNGPDDPTRAEVASDLGYLLTYRGEFEEGEHLLVMAARVLEASEGPDSPALAETLSDLGLHYRDRGETEKAKVNLHRAIDIRTRILGSDAPELAMSINNLAAIYYDEGEIERAVELFRRDLEISERSLGPDHAEVAISLNNVATALRELGRFDEALELYERSLEIRVSALGADHAAVGVTLHNIAGLHRTRGAYQESELLYDRSRRLWLDAFGEHHPNVAASWSNLGHLYRDQGRYEDAVAAYTRSLEIREETYGPCHARVVDTLEGLGLLTIRSERWDDADLLVERLETCLSELRGRTAVSRDLDLHRAAAFLLASRVHEHHGRKDVSLECSTQAIAMLQPIMEHSQAITQRTVFARALLRAGRLEAARPHVQAVQTAGVLDIELDELVAELL